MIGVIAPGRESECAKIMIGHGGSSCEIEARGRQTKTGKRGHKGSITTAYPQSLEYSYLLGNFSAESMSGEDNKVTPIRANMQ